MFHRSSAQRTLFHGPAGALPASPRQLKRLGRRHLALGGKRLAEVGGVSI